LWHSYHLDSIDLQPSKTIIISETAAAKQGPAAVVTPVLIPSQPLSNSLFVLFHCLNYFVFTIFLNSAIPIAVLHNKAIS